MEKSNHFRAPQVVAENVTTQGGGTSAGGSIQFDIAALYLPFAPDNAEEDKAESAEGEGQKTTPEKQPMQETKPAPEKKAPAPSKSTNTAQVTGGKH